MRLWACHDCGSLAIVRGGDRAIMPRCPDPGCVPGAMYVVDQRTLEQQVLPRATGRLAGAVLERLLRSTTRR